MHISQDRFDQQPLFIQQGALHLWGTRLARQADHYQVRELYWFSDFYAELCFDQETGDLTCARSFTSSYRLSLYLETIVLSALY